MSIKRYHATKDCSITNAYNTLNDMRATGSNTGNSDVLPLFSIYGQYGGNSQELSRVLIDFPVDSIEEDRTNGLIPAAGEVKFYLRMFNVEHADTTPREYFCQVAGLSKDWEEGTGFDIDNFSDLTKDLKGANWVRNASGSTWTREGGDYYTDASSSFEHFVKDEEDNILVDITPLVEQWIANTKPRNGVIVKLKNEYEAYFSGSAGMDENSSLHNVVGSKETFYVKKLFSRTSEYFFKKPVIEARWGKQIFDDRANFDLSSPLNTTSDNTNELYYYHYVKGALKDIAGYTGGSLAVNIHSGSFNEETVGPSILGPVVAVQVDTGIYKAEVQLSGDYELLHDVWSFNGTPFLTGSIEVNENIHGFVNGFPQYGFSMPFLKTSYKKKEKIRFRVFTKRKTKERNIFKVFTTWIKPDILEKISFKVVRIFDNMTIVEHDLDGSSHNYTLLSYDGEGSYFDLDMSIFEEGYMYGFSFMFYDAFSKSWVENPKTFKFRVEPDIDEC